LTKAKTIVYTSYIKGFLFLLYYVYTLIAWRTILENKVFRLEDSGIESGDNVPIVTILDKETPSSVILLRSKIAGLENNLCYRGTLEGVSSFYQIRWLKSATKVECPK
jgi:hypothetical protein